MKDSASAEPAGNAPADQPLLKRAISRNLLLLLVVGDIVGGGIYTLVGEIGAEVGGAIWLPMLIALTLAVLTASSYAELVTKYPRAAGAALYVGRAWDRPFFTFMVAFAVMASGVASAATLARGVSGKYLQQVWEATPVVPVAVAFLLLVAALNLRGISESVKVNVVLTLTELAGLLLVVVIALAALGNGEGNLSRAFEFEHSGAGLVGAALAGTALAFYALIGFEDSVNLAEEAVDPVRDYPRALFGGIAIAGAMYLVIGVLAPAVLPRETMLDVEHGTPLLALSQTGPLAVPEVIFTVIAVLALSNGALINMLMASRLTYGMANERIIPPWFGRVNRARRTPWNAIVFTTVLAMALAATGSVASLASTTVALLLAVFTVVNVAVLVLRREAIEAPHFVAPRFVPVLGAVSCGGLLVFRITDSPEDVWRAALLLMLGAGLWLVNVRARRSAVGVPAGS